jgi:hypothetical protein
MNILSHAAKIVKKNRRNGNLCKRHVLALLPVHSDFTKLCSSHVLKVHYVDSFILIDCCSQYFHQLLLQVLSFRVRFGQRDCTGKNRANLSHHQQIYSQRHPAPILFRFDLAITQPICCTRRRLNDISVGTSGAVYQWLQQCALLTCTFKL